MSNIGRNPDIRSSQIQSVLQTPGRVYTTFTALQLLYMQSQSTVDDIIVFTMPRSSFDVFTFFLQLLSLVHSRLVTESPQAYPDASTHSVLVLRTQYRVSRRINSNLVLKCLRSYYPVVPAVVCLTSSCDMTGFEASGGCLWPEG